MKKIDFGFALLAALAFSGASLIMLGALMLADKFASGILEGVLQALGAVFMVGVVRLLMAASQFYRAFRHEVTKPATSAA
jgi:hypothetical protein